MTDHCMCMTGNSGACSHVGAILFALEYATKLKESESYTYKLYAWLSANVSNVQCADVQNYDFVSATAKHERLVEGNRNPSFKATAVIAESLMLKISDERSNQFLEEIVACGDDCGSIFRVLRKTCEENIPEKTAL